MNSVCRDIFTAIHKGQWLSIEYKNKDGNVTRYWIAIRDVNVSRRMLTVDGLHLGILAVTELNIFIDSIPNLKILNYLSDCNRLDATPYRADYALIDRLDIDRFKNGICPLEDGQFAQIVQNFQMKSRQESEKPHFKQLGINVISIPSKQGLYVLAYRKLELDVAQRCLRASETITLCKEFSIEGEKISIRQFLDAEDFALLADIEGNLESINKDLLDILYMEGDDDERVLAFNRYLQKEENVKKFLRIFPIVATTCISAHRIGEPEPYFDMTIMDEASQCNTAVSLVPIIRGRRMMLVGDPQQLSPVILLDAADNLALRRKYNVSADYDYIANSIYKTYLACDAVSEEVLLSYHYRCHEKIIDFNNRKYYNGKLKIRSNVQCDRPLVFVDVKDAESSVKNTSPMEALQILQYVRKTPQKDVGIITPFASQRKLILSELDEAGFPNIPCGTVHAFQGDEKDVILFSLAITDQTHEKTYGWLKNNKELINVATSRAREQLILLASYKNVIRFHKLDDEDD